MEMWKEIGAAGRSAADGDGSAATADGEMSLEDFLARAGTLWFLP